jgi:hypothetical protein
VLVLVLVLVLVVVTLKRFLLLLLGSRQWRNRPLKPIRKFIIALNDEIGNIFWLDLRLR